MPNNTGQAETDGSERPNVDCFKVSPVFWQAFVGRCAVCEQSHELKSEFDKLFYKMEKQEQNDYDNTS